VEKKRFWKAGWYHPLNKFLADASLTSPDSTGTISLGRRAGVTQPDGSIRAGGVRGRQRLLYGRISSARKG